MNKTELVEQIARKASLQKTVASQALDATISSIVEALATGDSVAILGFGTFHVKNREARIGRNPRTGESVNIPASKVASFKVGRGLKETLNK